MLWLALYIFLNVANRIIIGQCIGDLSAKLPYKRIADYGIIMSGLPSGKQLKHPSSYGRLTLKEILGNKDNIKIEGVK